MQRLIGGLLVVGGFLGLIGMPGIALAACAGTDRLALLETENPTAYAGIFRRAAEVPNGEGLFWRVERDGTAPSYLLGTFHDPEVAQDPLDPEVLAALEGARMALVEISDAEQEKMQKRMGTDPSFVFDQTSPGLSSKLTPAERADADAALAARGISLALIDKMRPAFQFSILALPQCVIAAMAAGMPVLDAVLVARAGAAGVPVKGLETYESALDSINSIDPAVTQRMLIETLRGLDKIEDFRNTSVALYRQGKIAALMEYEIWSGAEDLGEVESRRLFSAFAVKVIDDRNRAWIKPMVPQLARGGVFSAFGAMHLMGKAGVIELLRERGFTVTRLDG